MSDPILFCKLENSSLISTIGSNGTWVGTSDHVTGIFGNAAKIDDLDEFPQFTINTSAWTFQKGTIEWWQKTTWSVTNALHSPNSGYANGYYGLLRMSDGSRNWNLGSFGTGYGIGIEAVNFSPNFSWYNTSSDLDWTANVWNRFAIVFDSAGIGGGANKVQMYINGTLAGSTTSMWSNSFSGDVLIQIGNRNYAGADRQSFNGIIDNIKIYDYAKTDFDDMLWEDGEGIPINVFATQGTYSDKVLISWDAVVADLTSGGYRVYRATSSGGALTDISGLISSGESFEDTTVTPGVSYFYKVTSETSLAKSDYSVEVQGFASGASPDSSFPIPDETLPTYNAKVITGNIDLWQRGLIDRFPVIEYFKSFDRERIFLNQLSIRASNIDNIYSLDNPKSIYKNINWRGQPVNIFDPENRLIWDGELTNIVRDHGAWIVDLVSQNRLYSFRYTKVIYASSDWETGAQAVKNILDQYGVENYHLPSLNMSDGILTEAGALLKVNVTSASNKTLIEVLETIAKYSNADIYDYLGKIYMTVWRPQTSVLPKTSISDNDIIQSAKIEVMDKFIINDYSISYDGDSGTPANDTDNNNLGSLSRQRNGRYAFELAGSDIVTLKDIGTAVWVGEMAMKRTHRDFTSNPRGLMRCELSITMDSGVWIDLKTILKLTLSQEQWDGKIFEVYRMELDYERKTIGLELFELGS